MCVVKTRHVFYMLFSPHSVLRSDIRVVLWRLLLCCLEVAWFLQPSFSCFWIRAIIWEEVRNNPHTCRGKPYVLVVSAFLWSSCIDFGSSRLLLYRQFVASSLCKFSFALNINLVQKCIVVSHIGHSARHILVLSLFFRIQFLLPSSLLSFLHRLDGLLFFMDGCWGFQFISPRACFFTA